MATYVNDRRAIHEGRNPAMIPGPINPVFPKPQGPPVPILNMAHGPGPVSYTHLTLPTTPYV